VHYTPKLVPTSPYKGTTCLPSQPHTSFVYLRLGWTRSLDAKNRKMVYWAHVHEDEQLVMSPSYAGLILVAALWPLLALGVTFVRFGELPGGGQQIAAAVLGFVLLGVLSGLVLISLLRRVESRLGRAFVVVGYLLAAPLGYVFGILGPLTLEAFGSTQTQDSAVYFLAFPLAIGLYGSLPLICGAGIGWLIGRVRDRGP